MCPRISLVCFFILPAEYASHNEYIQTIFTLYKYTAYRDTRIDTDTHTHCRYCTCTKIVLKIKHCVHQHHRATYHTLQWHRRSMYEVHGTHMEKHIELKRENRTTTATTMISEQAQASKRIHLYARIQNEKSESKLLYACACA